MRRISHGLSKRLIVLAALLSLALTLLFSGVASASTTTAPKALPPTLCISATPLSQVVGLKQTAWVKVSVSCVPTTIFSYVEVKWGDGIIEDYPILGCMEVCHIPPYIVNTSHAYTRVGIYNPVYCVAPSPLSVVASCTTTRITVVSLDPPVA